MTEEIDYDEYIEKTEARLGIKAKSKPLISGPIKVKHVYTKREKDQEIMHGVFSKKICNYDFFSYCEYYNKDPETTAFDFVVNRKYQIEGCQIGINLTNYKPYVLFLVDLKNGKVIVNKMAENEEM